MLKRIAKSLFYGSILPIYALRTYELLRFHRSLAPLWEPLPLVISERHLIREIKGLKLSSVHVYDYLEWFFMTGISSVDE